MSENKHENPSVFPMGKELSEQFNKYFIGQAYLQPLTDKGGPVSNVTFEPGCRNNWHIHHAKSGSGQILLVTGGSDWYQAWGEPAQKLRPSDVVVIPAAVKYWHGVASDSGFSNLTIEVNMEDTSAEMAGGVHR